MAETTRDDLSTITCLVAGALPETDHCELEPAIHACRLILTYPKKLVYATSTHVYYIDDVTTHEEGQLK